MTSRTIKTAAVIAAACAFMGSAPAQSKNTEEKKQAIHQERLLESFKTSLQSDYQGIVEGTIYNIVIFKKYYPQLDYSQLLEVLNRSSLGNRDIALRYKAYLASVYLTHNATIDIDPVTNPSDHEYIFRQIAQQLENKFLVSK